MNLFQTGLEISSILQKVDLQIYSSFDCANIHAPGDILRTNICAGVEGGWKGQCSGDSGLLLCGSSKKVISLNFIKIHRWSFVG